MVPLHLPLNANIDGQLKPIKYKETRYLTEDELDTYTRR